MTNRNRVYIVLLLLSVCGFGFTWGDALARQMRKGNEAFEAGNYAEALQAYTEADVKSQANDQRLPQLYNNMGTTLYQQGQYDQAVAMYEKALEASQNSAFKADVLFNAGNSRFQQGDYQKALEAYERALKENPQHRQALQNKEIVAQLIEQQQQQQQQNQNQEQNQQDGQPQDQQPQNDGQPTPQPTPTANPDAPQPQNQQSQEAQPAEEDAEDPEQDLSKEEALRILDALMEKEQLQQEQRQVPPRPVEKDW